MRGHLAVALSSLILLAAYGQSAAQVTVSEGVRAAEPHNQGGSGSLLTDSHQNSSVDKKRQDIGSNALAKETGQVTPTPRVDATAPPSLNANSPTVPYRSGQIREIKPELHYLLGPDGTPVPVYNWTAAELRRMWQLSQGLRSDTSLPEFVIEKLSLSGEVEGNVANLKVEINILTRDANWHRIPLGFSEAALGKATDTKSYIGKGECIFQAGSSSEGLVAWIRGEAEQTHQVKLDMKALVSHEGDQSSLSITLPRAVRSNLSLQIPLPNATARGLSDNLVVTTVQDGGKTLIEGAGMRGLIRLAWQEESVAERASVRLLAAVGDLDVFVNGATVRIDTTLHVTNGRGEGVGRFRVLLPQDSQLLTVGARSGYRIVPITPEESNSKPREVEIIPDDSNLNQLDVELSVERSLSEIDAGQSLKISGLIIPDAMRQSGTIALHITDQLRLILDDQQNVRRVGGIPREVIAGMEDEADYYFEYYRQPFQLTARLVSKEIRTRVESQYLLDVQQGRIRLTGKLKYSVRGGELLHIDLDMAGWEIDDIQPSAMISVVGKGAQGGRLISADLVTPLSGEFELSLQAHQYISADVPAFSVRLPRPQGSDSKGMSLAVVAADNVVITPDI